MAKAACQQMTDAEVRRCGEQTGLDTLVVRTVNDARWASGAWPGAEANAVSVPPGEYARKGETQRN